MSAVDIDRLQIEIEASSTDAVKKLNELADALDRLKKAMGGGGGGLGGVKDKIKGIGDSAEKASKSFNLFKGALSGVGVRRITSYLGGAVASMNEYVETVNLFQVSMGGYYDEAMGYAQLVNEKLGVDPAQWMRAQGVFMSMGKGFGMAEKQAYDLSESLTELSYDIASLYNEDIESAATRLQSALAGEIEPIRRLGISISQATLQEYALSRGIQESVANMTEQEKALLRSLKLIEDAGRIGAVGDFARTLESPANAVRVLTQQFEQLKRAIGSVFLPIVIQAIPYVQAFTGVLTDMISGLAVLVGFEMPKWESSSWENTADAVGDTTAAVKKLKQATIGIDELNIIGQNGGGAGAGGGLSDWAADIEIPDLWNKAEIEQISTKAAEIKEKMEPILELALRIGAAFLTIKFAGSLFSGIEAVKNGLTSISNTTTKFGKGKSIVIGVALAAQGFWAEWDALKSALDEGLDWGNFAQSVVGQSEFIAGGAFIGNALGSAIKGAGVAGILASAPAFGVAFYDALKNGLDVENTVSMVLNGAALGASIAAVFFPGGAIGGAILGGAAGLMTTLAFQFAEDWDDIVRDFRASAASIPVEWERLCNAIKNVGDGVSRWIDENWSPAWGYFVENAKKNWEDTKLAWDELWDNIDEGWTNFKETFGAGWDKFWSSAGETVDGMINGVISAVESGLNWCINALNSLSWEIPDWVPSIGGKSFGFDIEPIALGRVDFFENGGFPEHGQMFIARESGPELVGTIGQKTAVANNSQIIAGVSAGVREAQSEQNALLSEQNALLRAILAKEGNFYLDGRAIKRSYDKASREAGVGIMAGGVL